jgi:glycosyltransferase involved in cell wall biosynthesis
MKILVNRRDWKVNEMRRLNDAYGGVDYYRLVKIASQMKNHQVDVIGFDIKKFGEGEKRWDTIFQEYDVYWTSYFADAREASNIFYYRDKHKKKVIIDLDDNYLDILQTNLLYDKFKPQKRDRAILSTTLSFADVIVTSTETLKQRFHKHFKDVYNLEKRIEVLPNMNDFKDWDIPKKKGDPNKIVIGYPGSNSHHDDLAMVAPVIGKLMKKYPNLYFEAVGAVDKAQLYLFKEFTLESLNRCNFISGTWTFKEYPELIANAAWDIGICPLVDSPFTRCKSHIKWMEFSMFKIPVIASYVYPYFMDVWGRQTIEDGETGILVKPSQWESALESLIKDAKLRKTLGQSAYDFIKRVWQYDGSEMSDKIDKILIG